MCYQIKNYVEHHKVGKTHIPVDHPNRVIALKVRKVACHWYGKLRRVWRSPEKQRKLREA